MHTNFSNEVLPCRPPTEQVVSNQVYLVIKCILMGGDGSGREERGNEKFFQDSMQTK